jgi:hypothetical protein
MSSSLQHWLRKSIASEFPNHPVGWVAKRNAQNRQCSCASSHLSPFPSGGNFFLFQRYVLIKIRGGGLPLDAGPLWSRYPSVLEELWISN